MGAAMIDGRMDAQYYGDMPKNKRYTNRYGDGGFTVIEVLLVLAIVVVVAGVVLIAVMR